MNYTPEMEKAMQQSNKICYAEYERKFEKRIAVEKRRDQEYAECKKLSAEFVSQLQK
ncbi:hypothetical protein J2Z83_001611 [Virgibacillus natechei]|uniref:Uncharacterized protein n=1 Tax=Virgibacillus natechei TaxID=1216297 RepID=A0ABS4IEZ7_9BACI|nr:hypothetical protein [Virgibacillus natechei]MBP1969507.1 hypothetical protein [Virgibacillus natechei]UZD11790.1 hypothetical protein OLD84_12640 [Virgibacillus natechei]